MKKIFLAVLVSLSVTALTLVSCSKKKESSGDTTATGVSAKIHGSKF
ncbi:MAG: hypothetical protein AB7O96_08905 [Pseudobdellovibrionaceae bacterium]